MFGTSVQVIERKAKGLGLALEGRDNRKRPLPRLGLKAR